MGNAFLNPRAERFVNIEAAVAIPRQPRRPEK
jgi:hypothetical protein